MATIGLTERASDCKSEENVLTFQLTNGLIFLYLNRINDWMSFGSDLLWVGIGIRRYGRWRRITGPLLVYGLDDGVGADGHTIGRLSEQCHHVLVDDWHQSEQHLKRSVHVKHGISQLGRNVGQKWVLHWKRRKCRKGLGKGLLCDRHLAPHSEVNGSTLGRNDHRLSQKQTKDHRVNHFSTSEQ